MALGITPKYAAAMDIPAGIKYLDLTVEDGKVKLVKVDMGSPELVPFLKRLMEAKYNIFISGGTQIFFKFPP